MTPGQVELGLGLVDKVYSLLHLLKYPETCISPAAKNKVDVEAVRVVTDIIVNNLLSQLDIAIKELAQLGEQT